MAVFFKDHIPLHHVSLPFPLPEGVDPNQIVEVKRPFSVDENLRALLTAIDSAKKSDAHYVSAVLPVFPYARQDKAISREGITASRVAREIEEHGANMVLTLDIHNTAIAGFFKNIPCENLHSSNVIIAYVQEVLGMENFVTASVDAGGTTRANYYAKRMKTKLAMGYKRRDYTQASFVEQVKILGEVVKRRRTFDEQVSTIDEIVRAEDMDPAEAIKKIKEVLELEPERMNVLFVDDMIATGGSLKGIVARAKEIGAADVWFACALPLFTYPAVERIDELYNEGLLKGVIGTNAIFHHPEEFKKAHPWYHEVAVEKYFADAMFNINHYLSISELLK